MTRPALDYDGYLHEMVSEWWGTAPRDPVSLALFRHGVDEAHASIARGDDHKHSFLSTGKEARSVEADLSRGGGIVRKTPLTEILRRIPANTRRNAMNFYVAGYQQVLRHHLGEKPQHLRGRAGGSTGQESGISFGMANAQLADYGFHVDADGAFYKGEKKLSPVLSCDKRRFRVRGPAGNLLWSGPNVTDFVKSFWYAEKVR
jgi:hypothetical protein